jgi:serpin B
MTPTDPSAPPTDLARGANQFALALWQHMPAGNLAVSPASMAIPLTIVWGGAKGTTAAQLANLHHFNGPADIVLSRWGNLARSLTDGKRPVTLKLANRIYAEKTYEVDTTYFTIARHAFDVWIEPVDFISASEEERLRINAWVADQTEQRIKDLLSPTDVKSSTKLVVVNAIYFLGDWAVPFDEARTQPRDFWVGGTTQTQVPTMSRVGPFRYASGDGAALIELPYKGDSMAMYVLVPDARDGLAAIEKSLEPTLKALQPRLAEREVAFTLPRFTIDPPEPLRLETALQALGVTDAFSQQTADFTGLARGGMFISSVVHKAFVKVDEKGTEAAAATAIVGGPGGPPPKPIELHADHPFLFVIVDKATGLIMFLGRVVEPK